MRRRNRIRCPVERQARRALRELFRKDPTRCDRRCQVSHRLVTVRIDTRDPGFDVQIELINPKPHSLEMPAILLLTDAEARELGELLAIFSSRVTCRSITGDPNATVKP
jgi:hypothetical protein